MKTNKYVRTHLTKPSVTVGIPAYNEASNLRRMIPALLTQSLTGFVFNQILIVSDGSTDETERLVNEFPDLNIKFVLGQKRLGKPARLNQIFDVCNTDVVVILDADVIFHDKLVLQRLLTPFLKDPGCLSTSGIAHPQPPKNFVQRIAMAGINIWETAKHLAPYSLMYCSEGSIRAFARSAYKHMRFPDTSADDVYSYLFSATHNWKFVSCPKAIVFYALPVSLTDYIRQQLRYVRSPYIQSLSFPSQIVHQNFAVRTSHRIKASFINLLSDPVHTFLYLLLSTIVRLCHFFSPINISSQWPILYTTKKL